MAVDAGIWPIYWGCGVTVFDGVVMDVFNMAGVIVFVAQQVFPITVLPQGLFLFGFAGWVRRGA